jgi:hypothetical protein
MTKRKLILEIWQIIGSARQTFETAGLFLIESSLYFKEEDMKHLRRILITLMISIVVLNMVLPARVVSAASKYGVILGTKEYDYSLYNNLTVMSPSNNIMVKAYRLCTALGLTYSYNSDAKKLTITNPNNGKYLVFSKGSRIYFYFAGKNADPVLKTATYKFYYDTVSGTNVIHASTLKYIVNYNYYKDVSDHYYGDMGYQGVIAYSINAYSTYDIPVTDEVIDYVNSKTFTSAEELLDAVRLNMVMHRTGFTFTTNRSVMDEIGTGSTVLSTVLALDNKDTSKDADYLSLLIDQITQGWTVSTSYIYTNGREKAVPSPEDNASTTIDVKYESTIEQEKIVDSKIAAILKSLKLTADSDYEKVKKIHDYVINLASYDTTLARSSAYELLINKSAVCEGYTLAAYRLFTDAGLECRIITGTGQGERHAWNIVKVDGQWYNIDLTWDDPISSTGKPVLSYDYFLKSDADFLYHIRDVEFRTSKFLNAYPVAKESYPVMD